MNSWLFLICDCQTPINSRCWGWFREIGMFPLCVRTQIYARAGTETWLDSLKPAVWKKNHPNTANTWLLNISLHCRPWPLTHVFQRMSGICTEVQALLAEKGTRAGSIGSHFPVPWWIEPSPCSWSTQRLLFLQIYIKKKPEYISGRWPCIHLNDRWVSGREERLGLFSLRLTQQPVEQVRLLTPKGN